MKIHAFIFNWRGHESQAVALEQQLGPLAKVTVINSDEQAVAAHPHWVHLGESAYCSAQWNKAVELFSGDLLFHIQADASCDDMERLLARATSLYERVPLGVYEPCIARAVFNYDRKRLPCIEPDVYQVPLTDNTCWCISGEVVHGLPPIDISVNKLGWGIADVVAATARQQKKICVRDYSVAVRHPRGTGYSMDVAIQQLAAYYETLPPALMNEIRLIAREREQLVVKSAGKRGGRWKRRFRFLGRIFGTRGGGR